MSSYHDRILQVTGRPLVKQVTTAPCLGNRILKTEKVSKPVEADAQSKARLVTQPGRPGQPTHFSRNHVSHPRDETLIPSGSFRQFQTVFIGEGKTTRVQTAGEPLQCPARTVTSHSPRPEPQTARNSLLNDGSLRQVYSYVDGNNG